MAASLKGPASRIWRVPGFELDEARVVEILKGHNLVGPETAIHVRPLGGGVSSRVFLAEAGTARFVLKQPLGRFRVTDDWRVDDRRAFVEFAFARAFARLLPAGSIAPIRTFLPEPRILVFEAALPDHAPWKERLLAGDVDPRLGAEAGRLLARIHEAAGRPEIAGRFHHADLFRQQRLEPYFVTSAQRVTRLAPRLVGLGALFAQRADLVHGDFSPKNLLTDGGRLTLVDHEVATRGDAAFDVAFLLAHLALKGIHRPASAARLNETGQRFLEAYAEVRRDGAGVEERAMAYLGGLLVARVVGKSPVEYLEGEGRSRALQAGEALLEGRRDNWSAATAYFARAE